MSIFIKDIPLAGCEISIMKDGERYRARVDGIWCEVEEIPTTETDSDTISRAKAIAEVEKARAYVGHRYNIESMVGRDIFEMLDNVGLGISKLPPANTSETPNSSDTISRQAAIDALYHVDEYNGRSVEAIRKLPPAQPKSGKWIDAVIPNDNGGLLVQVCDQCNTFFPLAYTGGGHHFCPNCGADMREETE